MATLYIAEIDEMGLDSRGQPIMSAIAPSLNEQIVTISGSSAQSAVFNSQARFIELHPDAVCSVVIGDNPTATTANRRIGAGDTRYYTLRRTGLKVAVIANV
jgi:hypothetical protein